MLNAGLNRSPLTRSTCIATTAALLVVTATISGFGASAQSGAASFSGSVMDAIGRILPDAPIVLVNTQSSAKHDVRSDQTGHFQFADLPAGDYQLKATLPGFGVDQGRVTLGAGQNLRHDVVLQVGSVSESITIGIAGPPQLRESAQKSFQPRVDRCSQSAIGGCIDPPMKIRDVKPRYPQHLWDAGTGGLVKVEGRIGTDGFLKDLRVLAPADPDLANALLDAVRQWQFTATRLDGVPIEVRVDISGRFNPQP